jgi:cysteine synthase
VIINEGLFVGSSSLINLAACVKYARQHPNQKIVTILHDSGNRYASKFYSKKYLQENVAHFKLR